MPEDPEDSAIYNLLINSDPETMGTLTEQLNELTAKGLSVADALNQINAAAAKATDSLDEMAGAPADSIAETTTKVEALNEQLQETQTQTERVNELLTQMRQNAAEAASAIPEPPPFPGLEEGAGGGGGGSYFAVGHAASVAGHALGAPALSGLGAGIYIEEGLKRVVPLFEQVGQAAANSSPMITGLVSELGGLSVPMAGLLAIAVPLAIGVAGLAIGMQAYNAGIKEGSDLLSALIKNQDDYYSFIKTATTDEAKHKVQSLQDENVTAKAKLDENVGILKDYYKKMGVDVLGEGTEYLKNLENTYGAPKEYDDKAVKDAYEAAKKYAEQLSENDIFIGRLTGDIKSNALANNDAADAAKKSTDAAIAKSDSDAAFQRQLAADQNLSAEQGKKRLEYLQGEGPIIQGQMEALKPFIATSDEAKKKYDDLNNQLNSNIAEIQYLTGVAVPAAQHTKDLADAAKALSDSLDQASKAHETYLKAVQNSDTQLANQKTDAAQKEAQQEAALTQGSIQDSYQRSQIVLAESRKEVALAQDTANAIADVRTKLGQKEIADLTQYNRQLMDDQTKYQQDVQKDTTATYRKERDDYQAHAEKLADIQKKEATDQQDALLNRNFLALARVSQGHQGEIDAENTAYARKQAANQQHLQEELADLALHQAEVRTQQFVEYQRKLVDDRLHAQQDIDQKRLAEERKLQVLRTGEQQQLADLTTTEIYKIQILRQGFAQEIALYEQQAQRRVQIAAQAEQQTKIHAWSDAVKANPGARDALAKSMGLFDQGGNFSAGEPFMKGDIDEIFSFGSQSYAIPGAAMVMPLQSGVATPMQGGGSHNITVPVQIYANTKQQAAQQASQQVYKRIMETFGE